MATLSEALKKLKNKAADYGRSEFGIGVAGGGNFGKQFNQNVVQSKPIQGVIQRNREFQAPKLEEGRRNRAFVAEVLRAPVRSLAQVTNTNMGREHFVPQGNFQKTIYGDKPVDNFQNRVRTNQDFIQDTVGIKKGSKPIAFALATGGLLGDLLPNGGAKKQAAKPLIESTATRAARNVIGKVRQPTAELVAKLPDNNPIPSGRLVDSKSINSKDLGRTIRAQNPKVEIDSNTIKSPKQKGLSTSQTSQDHYRTIDQSSGSVDQVPQRKVNNMSLGSYADSIAEPSKYYNTKNLRVTNKAKKAIQDEVKNATDQLKATVGGKLSNREVIATANQTASVLNRTVTREQTASKIADNLNLRRKIAETAKSGRVDQDFINLWLKDKAAGEDIARQLQARRIVADPSEASHINILLENIIKVNKNADDILKAAKGVDFNDPKQATEFYRTFVKPKKSEWIDLLRYNSMLSSPNTHISNVSSNFQGTGIIAPIEKTITGGLDALRSAITGSKREYLAGEGMAYAKGYYSNVRTATQKFSDVMRGNAYNLNPDIRNIPLATSGGKKAIEDVLSIPTKLLEAGDQFFTALTEGGANAANAYKQGKGIKIKNPNAASEEAAERLFRADTNQDKQGHLLNAMDFITNKLQEARGHDNAIVSTLSKFTLPFVRTPMNILKQGVEYSPAGIITMPGASNKIEQLSKAVIGTASALGVATLLGTDRLSWGEPVNQKQKNAFRAAGMQPYSVKVGDNWISYSKLHPALAFNFALVSAVDDAIKNRRLDDSEADSILSGFAKYGSFIADQSYLKNIGDFVATTKGDEEGWTRYLSSYAQQAIPFRALMGWVNRLIDPVQRQSDPDASVLDRQMQQIMAQIPVFSQNVPARLGPNGQPVENQNRIVNAFSPARITTENPQAKAEYDSSEAVRVSGRMKDDLKKVKPNGKPGVASTTTTYKGVDITALPDNTYTYKINGETKTTDDIREVRLNILKNEFKKSGKASEVNNNIVFRRAKDGSVSVTPKIEYDTAINTNKMQGYKASGDYKSWVETAEKQYALLIEQANDPSIDELELSELQEKMDTLAKDAAKYKGYGGFSKGRKVKKPSQAPRISLSAIPRRSIQSPSTGRTVAPPGRRGQKVQRTVRRPRISGSQLANMR